MNIYAHALQETDRKAVNALEKMLLNTHKIKKSHSGSQMVAMAIQSGILLYQKVRKTPGILTNPGI